MNIPSYAGPSLDLGDVELCDEDILVLLFHVRKRKPHVTSEAVRMLNDSAREERMRRHAGYCSTPDREREVVSAYVRLIERNAALELTLAPY